MRNLFGLGAIVLAFVSAPLGHCAESGGSPVPIMTNAIRLVGGWRYQNVYTTASEKEALAKLELFRKSATPVTLQEFLGGKLSRVDLVYWKDDPARASELLRGLLNSIILQPGGGGGPTLRPSWAEGAHVTVMALLLYSNGRVGILESNGMHLFFEDGDGTYWWHRWDAFSPRRVRNQDSQPGSAASQRQPANLQKIPPLPSAGSGR